jgi:putative sugar O-methyltransferase
LSIADALASLFHHGAMGRTSRAADESDIRMLCPLFDKMPATHRVAFDVGASSGAITRLLASLGFKVYAVEPHPTTRAHLMQNVGDLVRSGRVEVVGCAASEADGTALMYVGSADTVNSLEEIWTTRAFPEHFVDHRTIEVPTRTLRHLLDEKGIRELGFLKLDIEGHELSALRGLFGSDNAAVVVPIIMLELNQRFPERARECIALLSSRGYGPYDIVIKEGESVLAVQRFEGCDLPEAWHEYGAKYYYANLVAYRLEELPGAQLPDLDSFLKANRVEAARWTLEAALRLETSSPVLVHGQWEKARRELRQYIRTKPLDDFLCHPVSRTMFFRTGWSAAQEYEYSRIMASDWGRTALVEFREPPIGSPMMSPKVGNISTNMLGMLYYLLRLRDDFPPSLPSHVMEIGGGYGAFCYLFCRDNPHASYVIVDLPEALALQQYFLSLALPDMSVQLATAGDISPRPGSIILFPSPLMAKAHGGVDLLFSTFGFSELPRTMQEQIEQKDYFGAHILFLAGQLAGEAPEVSWVHHSSIVGAVMERFERVAVERFHIGKNYLLTAAR